MAKDDLIVAVKGSKTQQSQQLKELEGKARTELALLEDVRDYMKKRADIEKDYFEKLEKLSKSLSPKNKDGQVPVIARQTHTSFYTLLQTTESQAKARGSISEKLISNITDYLKIFNRDQVTSNKKHIEFAGTYHSFLWSAYAELVEAKNLYDRAQKESESAKGKYEDAIKPKKGAFASLTNVLKGGDSQERIEKLRKKMKATGRRLDEVRNNYLIGLDGVNALQDQYYDTDLPSLMKKLDGSYYSTFTDLINKYTVLETEYSGTLASGIDELTCVVKTVNRDDESRTFLDENRATFDKPSIISFASHGSDDVQRLTLDDFTKVILSQKLGLLQNENDILTKDISKKEKEASGLEQMVNVYMKTPEFGDAKSPLEEKLELDHAIDMLKAAQIKLLAQISALEKAGITYTAPVPEVICSSSQGNISLAVGHNQVKAIYDYDASDSSELSFHTGDIIEVLATTDADDDMWWEGRHGKTGKVGSFPVVFTAGWQDIRKGWNGMKKSNSNISLMRSTIGGAKGQKAKAVFEYSATCEGELSFQVGDMILVTNRNTGSEDWWEGENLTRGGTGQFPVNYVEPLDNMPTLDEESPAGKAKPISLLPLKTQSERVRAIYDFDGATPEELQFKAGNIISVHKKGDDDWWEGTLDSNGKNGLFPCNYVEKL